MQYFRTTFSEAELAMQALWAAEEDANKPHTSVHLEARSQDAFMCVTEPEAEGRLRQALASIGARFTESSEKPELGTTAQPVGWINFVAGGGSE